MGCCWSAWRRRRSTRCSAQVSEAATNRVGIDVAAGRVSAADGWSAGFSLPERHRHMYVQGLDMVGASLQRLDEVERFEAAHWTRHPWMKDVARRVRDRLDAGAAD